MPREHPTNPSVVHREVIRHSDNPGQLAVGKGMGDRQLHEVLLDVTRQEGFNGHLAPWVWHLAAIDQPQEALTSKAAQVAPKPLDMQESEWRREVIEVCQPGPRASIPPSPTAAIASVQSRRNLCISL